ncbi:hypothetical protein [Deinococcus ficus]|uniref:Uncharacterized protein n=1 Tax=Deinococcus ficus TaxID=317577 RepID=A0A221SX99_9DEIO|nr:hypothetical protein [Deinococcus ficus]ASN81258.1 hypothetical protein DFI_09760 [Deinococcus ficus]
MHVAAQVVAVDQPGVVRQGQQRPGRRAGPQPVEGPGVPGDLRFEVLEGRQGERDAQPGGRAVQAHGPSGPPDLAGRVQQPGLQELPRAVHHPLGAHAQFPGGLTDAEGPADEGLEVPQGGVVAEQLRLPGGVDVEPLPGERTQNRLRHFR